MQELLANDVEDNIHLNRFYHQQKQMHMVRVKPGGVYCTQKRELISTGLGSCVSACMWDPLMKVGGMNHFLLPFDSVSEREDWHPSTAVTVASRYGSHAMEILINQLMLLGANRGNLHLKIFGGAQMLGHNSMIGDKNIEFILNYAQKEHFEVEACDLGGLEPRRIMFDPLTGKAWLKRVPFSEVEPLQIRETSYARLLDQESHRVRADGTELFE